MSINDSSRTPVYLAKWIEHAQRYRVFDSEWPGRTIDFIEASDDFPFPISVFSGGPLAGAQFPLDITVLTDTDDDFPF